VNKAGGASVRLARLLGTRPAQLRFLPRWWRDRRSDGLGARRPWLTYGASDWLERTVRPGDSVFEWGSGGSTLFFLDRGVSLTSVEHDRDWWARVRPRTGSDSGGKVRFELIEPSVVSREERASIYFSTRPDGIRRSYEKYARAIDDVPDRSLDFVLIDGRARVACARHVPKKLKPGGFVVLDDAARPEYAEVWQCFAGYACRRFRGLGPRKRIPAETTVWQAPPRG
jgi:hypothetical protein